MMRLSQVQPATQPTTPAAQVAPNQPSQQVLDEQALKRAETAFFETLDEGISPTPASSGFSDLLTTQDFRDSIQYQLKKFTDFIQRNTSMPPIQMRGDGSNSLVINSPRNTSGRPTQAFFSMTCKMESSNTQALDYAFSIMGVMQGNSTYFKGMNIFPGKESRIFNDNRLPKLIDSLEYEFLIAYKEHKTSKEVAQSEKVKEIAALVAKYGLTEKLHMGNYVAFHAPGDNDFDVKVMLITKQVRINKGFILFAIPDYSDLATIETAMNKVLWLETLLFKLLQFPEQQSNINRFSKHLDNGFNLFVNWDQNRINDPIMIQFLSTNKAIDSKVSPEEAVKEINQFVEAQLAAHKNKEATLIAGVAPIKKAIEAALNSKQILATHSQNEIDPTDNSIIYNAFFNIVDKKGNASELMINIVSDNSTIEVKIMYPMTISKFPDWTDANPLMIFNIQHDPPNSNSGFKIAADRAEFIQSQIEEFITKYSEAINNIDFDSLMFAGPMKNKKVKETTPEKYDAFINEESSNRRYAYDLTADEYKQYNEIMFNRMLHLFELYYKIYRLSGWMNPLEAKGRCKLLLSKNHSKVLDKNNILLSSYHNAQKRKQFEMPEKRRKELDTDNYEMFSNKSDTMLRGTPDTPITEKRSYIRPFLDELNRGTDALINDLMAVLDYWGEMRGDPTRFAAVINDLKTLKAVSDPLEKFTSFIGQGGPLNVLHHTGPIADYFFMPPNTRRQRDTESNEPFTGLFQSQNPEDIVELYTLEELNNLSKAKPKGSNDSYEKIWENWVKEQNA